MRRRCRAGSRPASSTNCHSSSSIGRRSSRDSSGCRLRGPGQRPRRRERAPPLPVAGDPLARQPAVPADPDRGKRVRFGVGRLSLGGERRPLVSEVVLGPDAQDHLDGLVEERVALIEVDAESVVLRPQIAGGDGEREPPAGERVECGPGLGHQERVAVGEHQDVRDQPQTIGHRGAEGQRGEWVESVVSACGQPALTRSRDGR